MGSILATSSSSMRAADPRAIVGRPRRTHQLLSSWMRARQLTNLLDVGDLVQINRWEFSHWAVYAGREGEEHSLLHLTRRTAPTSRREEDEEGSNESHYSTTSTIGHAEVNREPFSTVAGGGFCRINNELDVSLPPFPPEIIVQRAMEHMGLHSSRNMAWNCGEQYAKWCRYGFPCEWMSVDELAKLVKLGDLVEVWRGEFSHWAVYVGLIGGEHCVAHLIIASAGGGRRASSSSTLAAASISSEAATNHGQGEVSCDPFPQVAGTRRCRVNNALDATHPPFPEETIVQRAMEQVGPYNYNLLWNNCEHFAKWCRHGFGESGQVRKGLKRAVGRVVAACESVAASGAAGAVALPVMAMAMGGEAGSTTTRIGVPFAVAEPLASGTRRSGSMMSSSSSSSRRRRHGAISLGVVWEKD